GRPDLCGLVRRIGRCLRPGKPITVPITDSEGNVKVMVTTADKGSTTQPPGESASGVRLLD
ncbi:hypothetical protein ABZ260_42925, partial [Streptosporangium sp. NPDC006013]|uniref:hypothetical protein n=1 Tax=Streptosporangium sp. NPDC006013 TaxID=3155596 RepID=UPI0033A96AF6